MYLNKNEINKTESSSNDKTPEVSTDKPNDDEEKETSEQPKKKLEYKIEGTTLVISGSGPMRDYDYANDRSWFEDSIDTVIIEDGITTIGDRTFEGMWKLTSVTIPDSVTSIGEYVLLYCLADFLHHCIIEIQIMQYTKSHT